MCSAVRYTGAWLMATPCSPLWGVERGGVVTKLTTFLFPLAFTPKSVELACMMCVLLFGEARWSSLQAR